MPHSRQVLLCRVNDQEDSLSFLGGKMAKRFFGLLVCKAVPDSREQPAPSGFGKPVKQRSIDQVAQPVAKETASEVQLAKRTG